MKVSLHDSATEFLNLTFEFRAATPFETNIISSVAQSVADGSRTYDAYFWWTVSDTDEKVIGIAMRTAPHGALLSPMPKEAIQKLAAAIAIHDDFLIGVGGPREVVWTFLDAYPRTQSAGSSRGFEIVGEELLYILEDLHFPNVIGEMKVADKSEYQRLYEWVTTFGEEAGVYMHEVHDALEDGLRRKSLHWWIVDGEIVSMAGHAPIVEVPGGSIARIGPVYTPPEQRRRGYAGALTAALSNQLMKKGAKVMLFTDAKNPTSNSVYQKIGYRKIRENMRITFVNPQ
jgi:ribosomal protein S18 acetylase RimI-like enzyme